MFAPCYCGLDHANTLRNTSAVATFDDIDTQKLASSLDFRPFSLYVDQRRAPNMIRPSGSRFFEGIMLEKACRADT